MRVTMTAAILVQCHSPQRRHASTSIIPFPFLVISTFCTARKQQTSVSCHARQHWSLVHTETEAQTHQEDSAAFSDSISDHEIEPLSASELQSRAKILTNVLFNNPNFALASRLLTPDLCFEHESVHGLVSLASRQDFLSFWKEMHSSLRLEGRESVYRIKEAAVDELQRKVWMMCEIKDVNEVTNEGDKESVIVEMVEMLTFDEKGKVCEIQDWWRRVKMRNEGADNRVG